MRFHIVGLGPIGSLLAFHLRRVLSPQHSITVVHKYDAALQEAKRRGGIIKVENGGSIISVDGFHQTAFDQHSEVVPPPERLDPRVLRGDAVVPGSRTGSSGLIDPSEEYSSPPTKTSRIHSLIITTKCIYTLQILRDLRPRISPESTIVLLQNGLGIYEKIIDQLYPHPERRPHIVVASMTHGAWMKDHLHVVHAGIGSIKFGIMPDGLGRDFEATNNATPAETPTFLGPIRRREPVLDLNDVADPQGDPYYPQYASLRNTILALSLCQGLYAQWKPIYEVQMAMRQKLVVNAVINPLTAILGCRNGDLFKHDEGKVLARRICDEASRIFVAQWDAEKQAALESDDGVATESTFPEELHSDVLLAQCEHVANVTSYNFSSMLMDVRLGRPTEIPYMTGYLLHLAKKYQRFTPTIAFVDTLMKLRSKVPLPSHL
ncbi:hypothetical protein NLI96_g7009 [Meripilus lineatus]|uniref:2-dehydropantoate 2-reductase n=1 Tax=Meripilus lineatus TaxID=2056292 RepID=A0AAD5YFE8_9APHY|nr:hypothetical protein NLI96_g7009 [Physisporinus lineatus]